MHFLVEVEGYFAGDSLCVQLINHLQKHCEKIVKGQSQNHFLRDEKLYGTNIKLLRFCLQVTD